jgi:hypothetical protein
MHVPLLFKPISLNMGVRLWRMSDIQNFIENTKADEDNNN